MTNIKKLNFIKPLYNVALLSGALLCSAVIISEFTISAATLFLNSAPGKDWAHNTLNKKFSNDHDLLTYRNIFYAPFYGFRIDDITYSNGSNAIISAESIRYKSSLPRLLAGTFYNNIAIDDLIIREIHTENKIDNADKFELNGFSLPFLPLHRIVLDMDIEGLEIHQDKTIFKADPKLKASMTWHEISNIDMKIISNIQEDTTGLIPHIILLNGKIDTTNLSVSKHALRISGPDYLWQSSGQLRVTAPYNFDLLVKANHNNLSKLTDQEFKSAHLNLIAKGDAQSPYISSNVFLETGALKEKELEDIALTVHSSEGATLNNLLWNINAKSKFKEQDVSISSQIAWGSTSINASDFIVNAPKISGSGNLIIQRGSYLTDGEIKLEIEDLSYYQNLLNTHLSGSGIASLNLKSDDYQALSGIMNFKNLEYDSYAAEEIKLDLEWPDLSRYQLANVQLTGKNLRLPADNLVSTIDVTTQSKIDNQIDAHFKAQFSEPKNIKAEGSATLSAFENDIPSIDNLAVWATSSDSKLNINGHIYPDNLDISLKLAKFSLSELGKLIPENFHDVRLSSDINFKGSLRDPRWEGKFEIHPLIKDSTVINAQTNFDGSNAVLQWQGKGPAFNKFIGTANAPLQISLMPFKFENSKENGFTAELSADVNTQYIKSLFLDPVQTLTGALNVVGTAQGSFDNPQYEFNITSKNLEFTDKSIGVYLYDIDSAARITNNAYILDHLTINDGLNNLIKGSGQIDLTQFDAGSVRLETVGFHIPQKHKTQGIFDANLTVQKTSNGFLATGEIKAQEFNFRIPSRFRTRIPELNIVDPEVEGPPDLGPVITLDISLVAPHRVFVRGWGINAEFGGKLDVKGEASNPLFYGSLNSIRAKYEDFGKSFFIEDSSIDFQGEIPPSPYLNIKANTDLGDMIATVLITGEAEDPDVGFASNPSMPEDEIVSRILFDKTLDTITPYQAVQLTRTFMRYSGRNDPYDYDPMGLVRGVTGLDEITVDIGEDGKAHVGAGKYLTDRIYLNYNQASDAPTGSATVDIEVTPRLSVETEIGQDARVGGAVFWKREY
jgi:translocation and assembly module TamB